ncbi:MAG: sugar ABC transporter substrate-binding protein [Rubrobacteraceae bacterium]
MAFDIQKSTMTRRRMLRNMGFLGLGAMSLPVLGGCGGGSDGGGGGNGGGETIRIASIRWSSEDIFFNAVQYGQELEVERLRDEEGINVEFTVSAASDESEQVNAMQTQLDSGVQGILHTPWRGEAMIPLLTQARDREIPVVTHNLIVPEAPQNHVAVDNVEAGRLAAESLVRRLEELRGPDWMEEEGLIIATRCFTTEAFDIARFTGFEEVMNPIFEEHPNLTLEVFETDCDAGEARTGVDDLLSRYGNDALMAIWSIEGTGAVGGIIPALDSRNLMFPADDPKHIPLTSIDGTGPEMEAISRGQLDHASQQPTVGEGIMSMRLLVEIIQNGGEIPDDLSGPTVYEDAEEVWQPLDVVEDDRFDGLWYQLPIVEIPRDIPPDSPDSWPNQIEGEVEGASTECGCGPETA